MVTHILWGGVIAGWVAIVVLTLIRERLKRQIKRDKKTLAGMKEMNRWLRQVKMWPPT